MDRILVIGATGQLGRATIRKLMARNASVRALVRSPESAAFFEREGVEAVFGDLTDPESLARACAGVSVAIATANAAMPTRREDTFEAVERDGYRNLVHAATSAGVRRFVYTSAPTTKYERLSPFVQFKRQTEQAIAASGLDHVIFRADVFMDVAFAMMGSTIPLRGAEGATVLRPFPFANRHFARIKESIEQKHVALIPGDGTARHAFISIDDVAGFLTAAAFFGPSGVHAIGGPEALTFRDIVRLYEGILGVPLRVRCTPAPVFRVASMLARPFSPAAANLFFLNYVAATEETFADPEAAPAFGIRLTSAARFLGAKCAAAAAS